MIDIIYAILITFLIYCLGWILYFHYIEPFIDKWLENRKDKCYNDDNKN